MTGLRAPPADRRRCDGLSNPRLSDSDSGSPGAPLGPQDDVAGRNLALKEGNKLKSTINRGGTAQTREKATLMSPNSWDVLIYFEQIMKFLICLL